MLVEDNKYLPVTLQSLLNQDFDDYEIILADMNNDCRQFAGDEKIIYLKLNRPANKYEILNVALEIASGDYILFLSDKNFIYPNATKLLVKCLETDYHRNYNNRKNYINAKNYSEVGADIVCSTQYLEENISGDTNIGIPDKKFSMKIE